MATVKIVPTQDWEVLRKYLDATGVVLIPEDAVSRFPEKDAAKIREADEFQMELYDFGGEADVWVDIIHGPDSYAAPLLMEAVREQFGDEDETTDEEKRI